MKITTYAQAERAAEGARLFYDRYIREAAEQAGGMEALSLSLGMSPQAVWLTVKRGSMGALRRMAKRIHDGARKRTVAEPALRCPEA